jgi:hypothetical protein
LRDKKLHFIHEIQMRTWHSEIVCRWRDRWIDVQMGEQMGGHEWKDARKMDGWMDGRMGGWMDGWINEVILTCCFQKEFEGYERGMRGYQLQIRNKIAPREPASKR